MSATYLATFKDIIKCDNCVALCNAYSSFYSNVLAIHCYNPVWYSKNYGKPYGNKRNKPNH